MKEFFLVNIMFLLCSCSSLNGYLGLQDDNLIEEIAEEVIENQLGVDVDLTPSTPE